MIKSLFHILVNGCDDFIETSISDFLQQAKDGLEAVNADAIEWPITRWNSDSLNFGSLGLASLCCSLASIAG